MLSGGEPTSTARTTPHRVSIARRSAASSAAGFESAGCHLDSVKWTCVFQNPAITVCPAPESMVAPAGTAVCSRGPTAVITPLVTTMVPSAMGDAVGDG